MRKINWIVVHCSATKPGMQVNARVIDGWHRKRGWQGIGYHFVVLEDGTVETGRPLERPGAHCTACNADSVGVCYVGGLDRNGQPADTRTLPQRKALAELIRRLLEQFPEAEVTGHRDWSPDRNGDGTISPSEYVKACPCFDVRRWVAGGMLLAAVCLTGGCRSVKRETAAERTTVRTDSVRGIRQQHGTEQQNRRTEKLEQQNRVAEWERVTVDYGNDGKPRTAERHTVRYAAARQKQEKQTDSAGGEWQEILEWNRKRQETDRNGRLQTETSGKTEAGGIRIRGLAALGALLLGLLAVRMMKNN